MPLFGRRDDDEDQAQSAPPAGEVQSAQGPHAASYQAGSLEGIPESGRERIARMKQDAKRGFFTSDLSVNEFLLVKESGFEPVGLVLGSSIYHIGFQQAAWNRNQEMVVLTQAMYHARELAMTRMEEEADQLGADGVVGVRLEIGRYDWGPDLAEFIAVGTAVRHREGELHRAPNGRPFTSDLSGQDFATLLRAGYRPTGLTMGNCVYHVARQGMMQTMRQAGRNVEQTNFTQALYEARELAMERMQNEADELQSEGIVGARIIERSHGWGSHVIEFFAIGTVGHIGERRPRDRAPRARDPAHGLTPPGREPTNARRSDPRAALPGRAPRRAFHPLPRADARGRARGPRLRGGADVHGAQRADHVPGAVDRLRERPRRTGDPGPQPRLVHGPLLHRRLHPPQGPVHGEVAAVRARAGAVHLQPRRRVPGAPRRR